MTYRHFNNESTRSSVIRAVADTGNQAAWQRLFDLYAGFIFSIARSKGLSEEDADKLTGIIRSANREVVSDADFLSDDLLVCRSGKLQLVRNDLC